MGRTQPPPAEAPGNRARRFANYPTGYRSRRPRRCSVYASIRTVTALISISAGLALEWLRMYHNVLIAERVIAFSVMIAIAAGCFYLWLTRHGGSPNVCLS